ncbi:VWA domain-containing protein [Acanthopleuribacter pedis]|uniref:VWA domain-containing protein n=1 Tax=Acanthopleuribacter pedis TaxID=442870 RepID=A0A8J7U2T4_9BACT|nr:VWA domain-containing protein [Acanthopleuribacter pedis]MBO1317608.1 VWA domain-containing protein [Acanthopleuribacter pedis]
MSIYLLALVWLQNPVIDEELRVTYVLLDVKAADRRGNPVHDLKKEDFVVTENKKPVEVTFFEMKDFQVGVPDVVQTGMRDYDRGKTPPGVRQIILALDFESLDERQKTKTFAMLRDFLKNLEPPFTYLINIHSLERGSVSDGFVSSPKRAIAALDAFEHRMKDLKFRGGNRGLLLGDGGDRGFQMSRGPVGSGGTRGEIGDFETLEEAFRECVQNFNGMGGGALERCLNDTLNQFMEMHQFRTERVLGELEILAATYTDTESLKLMFFVSPGFTMSEPSSATQMAVHILTEARSGTVDPRRQRQQPSLLRGRSYRKDLDLQRVLHTCIKNRVIFHTFDVYNTGAESKRAGSAKYQAGVSSEVRGFYRSYVNDVGYGLRELANESGGSFTRVFTLRGPMIKTIAANQVFYVLGYNSPPGKAGKYRKIKIKSKRRGVKLAYRSGYFGG